MTKKITELPAAGSVSTADLVVIVANADTTTKKAAISLVKAALAPTGTGFVTVASGAWDSAGTANIRYTGGKFQTDANVQWKNGSVKGDLAWTPTSSDKTLTLPDATDTLVGKATTDTLTNKTLTAPAISTISNTGTITLPTATDTLVGRDTTDTLTNKTISGASNTLTVRIASDVSGLGADVATFLATPSSANLKTAVTDETGSGALVFGTGPTLSAPVISTISNTGTLTLPTSTDTLVGKATSDVLTNKTIDGASNTLTVRVANDISGLGSGVAAFLGTASSANLKTAVTDETGSGALVFADTPTLVTPVLGAATGTSATLSSFCAVGTSPAGSGGIRLATGANGGSIQVRDTGGTARSVYQLGAGGSHEWGGFAAGNPNHIFYAANSGSFTWQTQSSNILAASDTAIITAQPIGGYAAATVPMRFKSTAITQSSTADTTMTAAQYACPIVVVSGTPGGNFKLIGPNNQDAVFIVTNSTANILTLQKSGGTGFAIAAGKTAIARHDGSDYVRVTADV